MATIAQADAAAARRLDLVAMVKEAGITALIALVLTAPLVGIRTVEQSGSLSFETITGTGTTFVVRLPR